MDLSLIKHMQLARADVDCYAIKRNGRLSKAHIMRKDPNKLLKPNAANKAAVIQRVSYVKVLTHIHRQRILFQHIHIAACGKDRTNNCAHAAPGHHIDRYIVFNQHLQHADMRKSLCAARTEG